jgi:hypothetical protein
MLSSGTAEHNITSIACMDKNELKKQIQNFHGRFELDFTDSYLNKASEDHLRHILFAALVQTAR